LLIDKNHKIIGRYRDDAPEWYKFDYNEGNLADLQKKLAEVFKN
jgi:hypothetical protein